MTPSRAIPSIIAAVLAALLSLPHAASAGSEVYIQQARGHVAPGSTVMTKPPPESTTQPSQVAPVSPTAPDTCNAQNAASSQACYTATQQARPASR
ncbi:hypothetical protein [Bradyrhizobium sp. STM 3557]|uniref:hypothetical protein n=1 Tax=Bradyrhizobium sp. STM 3557 TaxID=578920 RepID=UPI003890864F